VTTRTTTAAFTGVPKSVVESNLVHDGTPGHKLPNVIIGVYDCCCWIL